MSLEHVLILNPGNSDGPLSVFLVSIRLASTPCHTWPFVRFCRINSNVFLSITLESNLANHDLP